jgi:hypothetical protein
VEAALKHNVFTQFAQLCPDEWKCEMNHQAQYPGHLVGLPDGVIWEQTTLRILLSGETKTPWTLRSGTKHHRQTFVQGQFIAENWDFSELPASVRGKNVQEKKEAPKFAWGAKLGTGMRKSLSQLVGYMIDNKTPYAYLTSYDRTWFLHAISCDHVEITNAILATATTSTTSPSLMRAFLFVTHLAREAPALDVTAHAKFRRRSEGKEGADGLSDSKQLTGSDETNQPRPTSSGFFSSLANGPSGGPTTPSDCEVFDALPIPHASFLDLELDVVPLGSGRQGTVAAANWAGLSVALKMYDFSKHNKSAFETEATTYMLAKRLQGFALPRLLFKSVSPSGQVYGLGIERGLPLPDNEEDWTPEQVTQSLAALKALGEIGVRHNDIRSANFVELRGSVKVIDFEDVSFQN